MDEVKKVLFRLKPEAGVCVKVAGPGYAYEFCAQDQPHEIAENEWPRLASEGMFELVEENVKN